MGYRENILLHFGNNKTYNNVDGNAIGATTSTTLRTVTAHTDANCKYVRKFGTDYLIKQVTDIEDPVDVDMTFNVYSLDNTLLGSRTGGAAFVAGTTLATAQGCYLDIVATGDCTVLTTILIDTDVDVAGKDFVCPADVLTDGMTLRLYLSDTTSTYYDEAYRHGGARHTPDGTEGLPYFTLQTADAALAGAFTIVTVLDSETYEVDDYEITVASAVWQAALGQTPTLTYKIGARLTREMSTVYNNLNAVFYNPKGSDTTGTGTWQLPYATPENAITNAGALDIVYGGYDADSSTSYNLSTDITVPANAVMTLEYGYDVTLVGQKIITVEGELNGYSIDGFGNAAHTIYSNSAVSIITDCDIYNCGIGINIGTSIVAGQILRNEFYDCGDAVDYNFKDAAGTTVSIQDNKFEDCTNGVVFLVIYARTYDIDIINNIFNRISNIGVGGDIARTPVITITGDFTHNTFAYCGFCVRLLWANAVMAGWTIANNTYYNYYNYGISTSDSFAVANNSFSSAYSSTESSAITLPYTWGPSTYLSTAWWTASYVIPANSIWELYDYSDVLLHTATAPTLSGVQGHFVEFAEQRFYIKIAASGGDVVLPSEIAIRQVVKNLFGTHDAINYIYLTLPQITVADASSVFLYPALNRQIHYVKDELLAGADNKYSVTVTSTNEFLMSPLFNDPENGDFGLPINSPCYRTASDGGDIGYERKLIKLGNDGITINGFILDGVDYIKDGIYSTTDRAGTIVKWCDIKDMGLGIQLDGTGTVSNCKFPDNLTGVYSFNDTNTISNNLFYNHGTYAVYLDGQYDDVDKNVFYNNAIGVRLDYNAFQTDIKNNVFHGNTSYDIDSEISVEITYNCITGISTSNVIIGVTNITENPLFVSETAGSEDFHIQTKQGGYLYDSPCLGIGEGGIDIGSYTVTRTIASGYWQKFEFEYNPSAMDDFVKVQGGIDLRNASGSLNRWGSAHKLIFPLQWSDDDIQSEAQLDMVRYLSGLFPTEENGKTLEECKVRLHLKPAQKLETGTSATIDAVNKTITDSSASWGLNKFKGFEAGVIYTSGTGATLDATGKTLTKAGAGWTTNAWTGYIFYYDYNYYEILSNTATILTLSDPLGTLVSGTVAYSIEKYFKIESNTETALTVTDADDELLSGSYNFYIDFCTVIATNNDFKPKSYGYVYDNFHAKTGFELIYEEL